MLRVLALMLVLFASTTALSTVYKSVGPDGKVTYSDRPPVQDSTPTKQVDGVSGRQRRDEDDPVKAAGIVTGHELAMDAVLQFCRREVPATNDAISRAHQQWMERHSVLIAKAKEIQQDNLDTRERQALAGILRQASASLVNGLRRAPADERNKTCSGASTKIGAYDVNLMANATLVNTLMNYRKKPRSQ